MAATCNRKAIQIGVDTALVAPVDVGDAAYTGAGSVITKNVPPGALGISRAQQRELEGQVGVFRTLVSDYNRSSLSVASRCFE
jgi:bifunctional N-acetylglucosamine-1-phosphate-uridyltransferase/glucosamine-1-phosphate-acetyltransferase GlmU-like protein